MKLLVDLQERSYEVIIEKGLINNFAKEIKKIYEKAYSGKKIFIITDENVNKYYGEKIKENLENEGFNVGILSLPPGEKSKDFNNLPMIFESILDFKLTRSDLIITLGGGVIGDIGGFVASTYLRGVDFIQIPTSLLAQVDSSVGGKVAVDLERGKNLVGSFYQPKCVLIDPEMLNTLPDRYLMDGMAEVIKYGCIKDEKFFDFLLSINDNNDLLNNMEKIIYKCCNIKRQVVENDEKDTGERMILNFGHTIGHGIEQYYNYEKYTHGEAVAIGMYEITKLSEEKNLTKSGSSDKIKEILIKYNLPYEMDVNIKNILECITLDKKKFGKKLNLILLDEIGKCKIHQADMEFWV